MRAVVVHRGASLSVVFEKLTEIGNNKTYKQPLTYSSLVEDGVIGVSLSKSPIDDENGEQRQCEVDFVGHKREERGDGSEEHEQDSAKEGKEEGVAQAETQRAAAVRAEAYLFIPNKNPILTTSTKRV
jgi:hypothetical protein